MDKTIGYLDAVKARENITSNYRLAKVLEIDEARISDYYKGKCNPDAYAAMQIALALEIDPLLVLAEIRAESEKNQRKREFWVNFRMRHGLMIAYAAALICGYPSNSEASNDQPITGRYETYSEIMRSTLFRLRRWLAGLFLLRVPA